MSEWKKVETPPEPIPEPIPVADAPAFDPEAELPSLIDTELPPVAEEPAPAKEEISPAERHSPRQPRSRTAAKRRNHMAAPLGFLMLVLALIGAIAVVVSGVRWVQKAADDTPLKEELAAFLKPVMLQNPTAFDGEKEAAQNLSCIKAALWQVTETERIRMRQEKDECRFAADDTDRLIITEREVNAAFEALFGESAAPVPTVFAEPGDDFDIWYDTVSRQYHVPAFSASMYQPVIDTIDKEDDIYRVRVGYVAAEDIGVDDQGEDIPPTAADATVFQYYRVEELEDGYRLLGIEDAVAAP